MTVQKWDFKAEEFSSFDFFFLSWNEEIEVGERLFYVRFPRDHITWKEIETQETFTITPQILTQTHQFIVSVSLIYHPLMRESHTKKPLPI